MQDWMYDKVERVPPISDKQIKEMRHIEPVLKLPESCMYRRIANQDKLHARDVSFIWNAEPAGGEFCFDVLNSTTIITQHHSSVFFKPSLAEVYAWIRIYMPDSWRMVRFFCLKLDSVKRIACSSDFMAECEVMGGKMLVKGKEVQLPGGIGYELVTSPEE